MSEQPRVTKKTTEGVVNQETVLDLVAMASMSRNDETCTLLTGIAALVTYGLAQQLMMMCESLNRAALSGERVVCALSVNVSDDDAAQLTEALSSISDEACLLQETILG